MYEVISTTTIGNNVLEVVKATSGNYQLHEIRGDFPDIDENTGKAARWVIEDDKDSNLVLAAQGKRIAFLMTGPMLDPYYGTAPQAD